MSERGGWSSVLIGDIADVRGGVAFPPSIQGRSSGKIPFYKVSDMNLPDNEVTLSRANNWVNDEDLHSLRATVFPAGTVVFPKVGAALLTNKKRILSRDALVDNNVMGVTIRDPRCLSQFLLYWFHTVDLRDLSNPGPLPSINGGRVKETVVSLPSIPLQRAIVRCLSGIEGARDVRRHELLAEGERKASLREYLFQNGTKRESHKQSPIGEIPTSWELKGAWGFGSVPSIWNIREV
jgi:type I restriction enzyme S subunit